jgi:hypothetical protein
MMKNKKFKSKSLGYIKTPNPNKTEITEHNQVIKKS